MLIVAVLHACDNKNIIFFHLWKAKMSLIVGFNGFPDKQSTTYNQFDIIDH